MIEGVAATGFGALSLLAIVPIAACAVTTASSDQRNSIDLTEEVAANMQVSALRFVYSKIISTIRDEKDIIWDIRRSWASRETEESGTVAVSRALDIAFIEERTHLFARRISCNLDIFGLNHPAFITERFSEPSFCKDETVRRFPAFWASLVLTSSVFGFNERFAARSRGERLTLSCSDWGPARFDDLEREELRRLAEFVGDSGAWRATGDGPIIKDAKTPSCRENNRDWKDEEVCSGTEHSGVFEKPNIAPNI